MCAQNALIVSFNLWKEVLTKTHLKLVKEMVLLLSYYYFFTSYCFQAYVVCDTAYLQEILYALTH